MSEHKQIEYKGHLYGYWMRDGVAVQIRSEGNPSGRTPCLRDGSKLYREVLAAILEKEAAAA